MRNGASFFFCDISDTMIEIARDSVNQSVMKADSTFKHIETSYFEKIDIDNEISKYSDYQK